MHGRESSSRGARRRFQRDLGAERDVRRFDVGVPDRGARLDVFLAARLRWASRARIRRLVEAGRVEIAGAAVGGVSAARSARGAVRLRDGETVVVSLDSEHVAAGSAPKSADTSSAAVCEWSYPVVYEDAWLLAVSKPPGCSVHPTKRHKAGSLLELVHRREREIERTGRRRGEWMPSPCHRLDRDTSGLVLFARDPLTRAAVGRQIEQRSVRKLYVAWVRGEVLENAGEIDLSIGADAESELRNRRAVRADGQAALTRFRVTQRLPGRTLLELEPVTGRTHQLRVHLAAIGHPILGDALYRREGSDGDALFRAWLAGMPPGDATRELGHHRLALHAELFELEHPQQGRKLALRAPPWDDLLALAERPRAQGSSRSSAW